MPSSKELLDYDNELRMAVSKSDFEALKKLHAEGKRYDGSKFSPCNC